MMKIFIDLFLCWLLANLILSSIASFSKIWYLNKTTSSMSLIENKILLGEATFKERTICFAGNMLGGIIAPPTYILAIVFFGILSLFRLIF